MSQPILDVAVIGAGPDLTDKSVLEPMIDNPVGPG